MSKTVDELADEALKEHDPYAYKVRNNLSAHYENGIAGGFRGGFKAGYEAAKPKWVRVEDDPPPQWQEVLFLIKNNELPVIGYRQVDSHTLGFENEMYLDTEDMPLLNVEKWMPLPEVENE